MKQDIKHQLAIATSGGKVAVLAEQQPVLNGTISLAVNGASLMNGQLLQSLVLFSVIDNNL